jgi:hypothetical protein
MSVSLLEQIYEDKDFSDDVNPDKDVDGDGKGDGIWVRGPLGIKDNTKYFWHTISGGL